jgi:NADH-quinone oxidoreductase subunit N
VLPDLHLVPDFLPALPEIILALSAMALLMLGAFSGDGRSHGITIFAVFTLLVVLVLVLFGAHEPATTFSGLFVIDRFAAFMKSLILFGAILVLVMSLGYLRRDEMDRFEYPVLILFSVLGMMAMVSANSLITVYVALELQNLPLYVIAAFQRDSVRSSEAGLKYFVLSALASGLLLYGCSLVYGFTGTVDFEALAAFFATYSVVDEVGVLIGLVFIAAGLAFKLSAVPFHMWTPDVYEGAPTSTTAFFAVAPKIAAFSLVLRIFVDAFGDWTDQWRQIIVLMSVLSMLLGAFAGITQTNIKRLMAYSTIGHIGYALIGLAAGDEQGVRAVLIYMGIYVVMTAGAFGVILAMRRKGTAFEEISDLAGLARSQPMLALAMGIFMFSLAGIPPTAGFAGKVYVFLAAIEAGMYTLAVIGVLTSVVAAYYYLRVVKVMFFDEAAEPFDAPIGAELAAVTAGTAAITLFFFVFPGPYLASAEAAAAALFR